jgi:hypothetical protein
MSHPIVNQDLAAFRPEQHRFPKSAEGIEANASSSHPLEDCRQTITEKTFGRKHISTTSLQQKSFFAVANVIRKHLGEGGVKIDVAKCGIGFQGSLYSALFGPLLPDEREVDSRASPQLLDSPRKTPAPVNWYQVTLRAVNRML